MGSVNSENYSPNKRWENNKGMDLLLPKFTRKVTSSRTVEGGKKHTFVKLGEFRDFVLFIWINVFIIIIWYNLMVKLKLQFQLLEKTTTPQKNQQTNKQTKNLQRFFMSYWQLEGFVKLTPRRKEIEESWTESSK